MKAVRMLLLKKTVLLIAIGTVSAITPIHQAVGSEIWVAEAVTIGNDQDQYASLVIDANFTPHAVWNDATSGSLYYAYRDATGWHPTQVDSNNSGNYSHIAINPQTALPAIAWYDQNAKRPKYAWRDQTGAWNTEYIDASDPNCQDALFGSCYVGTFISLAFGPTGTPYAAYHFDDNYYLAGGFFPTPLNQGLKVAYRDANGTWQVTQVDTTLSNYGVSRYATDTAIGLDNYGNPQVAYRSDDIGQLQNFAWRDGSGWHTETPVALATGGQNPSLAVVNSTHTFLSAYQPNAFGDDCLAFFTDYGNSWTKSNFDCGSGAYGQYSSLAGDYFNQGLHLVYYAGGQLKYAVMTNGAWTTPTTIPDTGDYGQYVSLALNTYGGGLSPTMVYYNATAKALKYAYLLLPPMVFGITPQEAPNDEVLQGAIVTGAYFQQGSLVTLFSDSEPTVAINGENIAVNSDKQITCDFDLTGARPDKYQITVSNGAGSTMSDPNVYFTVMQGPPTVTGIQPDTGKNDNNSLDVQIAGTGFDTSYHGTYVWLAGPGGAEIKGVYAQVSNSTTAIATISLYDAPTGDYTVNVQTSAGTGQLTDGFRVSCGRPTVDFSGAPRFGQVPLNVQFSNATDGHADCNISGYLWQYGDGGAGSDVAPAHTYQKPGTYTVTLTAYGDGGEATIAKANYIDVAPDDDDDTTDDDDDNDDDNDDASPSDDDDDDDATPADDDNDASPRTDDDESPADDDSSPSDDDSLPGDDDDDDNDAADDDGSPPHGQTSEKSNSGGCGC